MSLPRCFIPTTDCLEAKKGSHFLLDTNESHHLVQVRRTKQGASVLALNGNGGIYTCILEQAHPRKARLRVEKADQLARTWPETILVQALIKNKPMDWIIQKTTEIGVSRIIPVTTDNSEIQLSDKKVMGKCDKWRQVAMEACKQCGNPFLPVIEAPVPLTAIFSMLPEKALRLFGGLEEGSPTLGQLINSLNIEKSASPPVSLAIGPEGDFSPREYNLLKDAGFRAVSLGPLVLRAETAAIAALAITHDALISAAFRQS